MTKTVWKVRKGVWAGITPSGKRFMASSKSEALLKAGKKRRFNIRNTPKKKSGGRKMARRRRFRRIRRRARSFGVRGIFKWLRIGSLVAPALHQALKKGISNEQKLDGALAMYTGYSIGKGDFKWERLKKGWTPYIATYLITKVVEKIGGIIRRL